MKASAILSHNGKELPLLIQRAIKNTAKLCYVEQKVPLQELIPNPSGRKKRTQFEFALLALLSEILRYTDLMTLKVGIPQNDCFRDATLNYLSIRSGLEITRVKRVFKQLKAAGYIKVSEQLIEWRDGALYCSVIIKEVSYKLFEELGVKFEEISLYQHYKRKKEEIALAKQAQKQEKKAQKKAAAINKQLTAQEIKQKELEKEVARIRAENPGLSFKELYKLTCDIKAKPPP
jgi:hypothetical protein